MAQITHGVRAILSNPAVYTLFQTLMGGQETRRHFIREFVRPFNGMNVLDIGCGPAEILSELTDARYVGFDISEDYINNAKEKFGARGEFNCRLFQASDLDGREPFDLVLAMGLLHHLDEDEAVNVFRLAHAALKPGGRLVTIDPCLDPSQNVIARYLVRSDRGQNVRDREGYFALATSTFKPPRIEVRHQAWIPYTHCFMECTR